MKLHTILLQKTKAESVLKDTEKDFGVVCLGVTHPGIDTKEYPSNDWLDEDGTDVYIPTTSKLKGSSFSIKAGYKGASDTWESKMDAFLDYLTGYDGSGAEIMVYMPYHNFGRVCRLSNIPKPTISVQNSETIIEFELNFTIDNPRDRIDLGKDLHENINSLIRRTR